MKKYAQIIDENTKQCAVGLGNDEEYYKSIGMTKMDVEQSYSGGWYLKGYAPEKPQPTYEEQREARAEAYQIEVDPITSHIQRLRDEATPDQEKINELIQERAEKVQEIQNRYPYPEEEE